MSAQTYNIRRRSSWSVFLACIVAVLTLSACTQHTDEISDTEKEYVRNLISEAKSNADSLQAVTSTALFSRAKSWERNCATATSSTMPSAFTPTDWSVRSLSTTPSKVCRL